MLEFKGSRVIQGGSCKFFLAEDIMKSISKDATAFVDVNDLRQAAVEWPAEWLDKYADEMFEVIKQAILRADPKVTGPPTKQSRSSKEPSTIATELESTASTSTPVSIIPPSSPLAASATSDVAPKTPTRSKQKRADTASDQGSPLKSRNVSPARQQEVEHEMQTARGDGRPRRESAVKGRLARVDALKRGDL